MCEELLLERLRRGGGGIGLLSDIGLLGSVVGGVSIAGEPCAGGKYDLRDGGGGGTAFGVGFGDSSSSCTELWVRLELLRLRGCDCACACLRDAGGGGGGVFFGRPASTCGVASCCAAAFPAESSGVASASGGGGSGLFKSLLGDLGVDGRNILCNALLTGGVRGPEGCCQPVGIDSLKSANETVCGPLGPKALPCLCFGGGGGPSASGRDNEGPIKDACSLSCSSSSGVDC